jgi:hypothetical protein
MRSASQDQWGEWEWRCVECSVIIKAKAMLYLVPQRDEHMYTHLLEAEASLWN